MLTTDDIGRGVRGVIGMARNAEDWPERFDLSAHGVFGSFWAMLLSLPLIILANECLRRMSIAEASADPLLTLPVALFVGAEVVVAYCAWGFNLWLLTFLGQRLDVGWRISPLIMGQNWSTFMAYLVLGFGMGFGQMLGMSGVSNAVVLCAIVFSLWLDWGVIRRPLGVDVLTAVGLLFVMMAAAMLIDGIVRVPLMMVVGG